MRSVKKNKIIYTGIFLFLFVLCFMFPWSGDDWAWGSTVGKELLSTWFKDYNGRYLGNLLVYTLTRSRVLRACVMAATHTRLLFLLSELSGKTSGRMVIISTLLLLMPTSMFAQAVAWTSGFANYVPSITISLAYIYIVRDHFNDQEPVGSGNYGWINLVLGLTGALFVEHITIYNCCLGLFILVYTIIRFKRIYIQDVAFSVGAFIGAVVMFTNGAYHSISDGIDEYRTIQHSLKDMFQRAQINYSSVIIPCGFTGCFMLILSLCAVAIIAGWMLWSQIPGEWKACSFISLTIIVTYSIMVDVINIGGIALSPTWEEILMATTSLYLLAWFSFLLLLPIKVPAKAKLILFLGSAVFLFCELLIVTPIGPRCLFASYVFLCLLTISLLDQILQLQRLNGKSTMKLIGVCVIVLSVYNLYIYGSIFVCDCQRISKMKEDLAEGKRTIYIEDLVYDRYVWNGNPNKGSILEKRFKQFYHIDDAVKIENISTD